METISQRPRDASGRFVSAAAANARSEIDVVIWPSTPLGSGTLAIEFANFDEYVAHFSIPHVNVGSFSQQMIDDACARSEAAARRMSEVSDDFEPAYMNTATIDSYIENGVSERSFSSMLCKIWQWIRKAAEAIIEGIVDILKFIGRAALSLLSDLVDTVVDWFDGDFLGGVIKVGALIGVGYLAWLLLVPSKEEKAAEIAQKGALEIARINNGLA